MVESNIIQWGHLLQKPELSILDLLLSDSEMSLCLIHQIKSTIWRGEYSFQVKRILYWLINF